METFPFGIVVGVGAIVLDGRGRLLVVQRGRGPGAGNWSVPGGKLERGETLAAAAVREVREETGLDVVVTGFVGFAERIRDDRHIVILDFAASVTGGTLQAGDDAADAMWVTRSQLTALPTTMGLLDFLDEHGIQVST